MARSQSTAPLVGSRTRSQSARSAEDLMFFPKLRRRGEVGLRLARSCPFGVGFVAFGVGTGVSGTSIGDVLQDIIGQQNTGEDIGDAQKKAQENPRDAAAQLAFANALQQAGRTREAIAALERYTALAPKDTDALLQLATSGAWWRTGPRMKPRRRESRQPRPLGRRLSPSEQPVPPGRRAEQDRADPGSRGERARRRRRAPRRNRPPASSRRSTRRSPLSAQRPEHLPLTRSRRADARTTRRDRRLQAIPRAR